MADLWRLVHVNADHTRQIAKYMVEFPEFYSGQPQADGSASKYADSESLQVAILVKYEDVMRYMPKQPLYVRGPGDAYNTFETAGFGPGLTQGEVFNTVGERLYLDRWDAKHPYIEILGIGGTNITLGYFTAGGVKAYQVTINHLSTSSSVSCQTIPWVANLSDVANWETKDDCRLITGSLTYFITGGAGFGYSFGFIQSINVSSVDNAKAFWGVAEPLDGDNPYSPAGKTMPGGGRRNKQDFGDWSDDVTADGMPVRSAVGSGLISVFSPTASEMMTLSKVLWSKDFFNWVNNMVSNIDDLFIFLGIVPFNVTKGNTVNVTYFGFVDPSSTISLTLCSQQYYEIDMGTIDLANDGRVHRSDSVFDYSPFSKLGIYLPFIGFEELDIDEFRDKAVNLTYRIDILTGSCLALLTVNGKTLYQFSGNCMTQLPLTSLDASQIVSNSVNIATALVGVGSASAIAGAGAAAIESAMNRENNPMNAEQGSLQNARFEAQVSFAGGNLASATANGMMGMKPNFKHSGALGASTSLFAVKQPYLFLTTPNEAVPDGYEKYCGLPSNITSRLGDLSGYTVVEDIRLNGLVATSPEVDEIYKLLKTGVII